MAMLETRYEHIVLSDSGTPTIVGSTMKVIELVREHQAYGWSVEELYFQHPYLSLGQIHSSVTKICGRLSSEARFTPSRRRNSDSRSSVPQFLVTLNSFRTRLLLGSQR